VFRDRKAPVEMEEVRLKRVPGGLEITYPKLRESLNTTMLPLAGGIVKWSKILASFEGIASTSVAERLIKQGGLEVNGAIVQDPACKLNVDRPETYTVRVGKKKFLRIVVE
jgi:tyrosyl-tRNA synthetase